MFPKSTKAFFMESLLGKGDIFEGFLFDWAPLNNLKEIYEGIKKLETFASLDVPDDAVLKVVRTVAVAEKMGIKVGRLDKVVGDVCAKRDHFIMLKEDQWLSPRLEDR